MGFERPSNRRTRCKTFPICDDENLSDNSNYYFDYYYKKDNPHPKYEYLLEFILVNLQCSQKIMAPLKVIKSKFSSLLRIQSYFHLIDNTVNILPSNH